MFKDITASLVAATRKVVEASSAKAANEASQKEQASNLSKSMRPAYEGMAPRTAQEISLLKEKAEGTTPKTPKEKELAAMSGDKTKITKGDVLKARGVSMEEKQPKEPMKKPNAFDYKSPRKPQDMPNRKSGDVTMTGHDVKKISTGTVYTKRFEEAEPTEQVVDEATMSAKAARAGKDIGKPGKNFEKIAASAAKRYGSVEAGKKVAGAILAKMRMKEDEELTDEQIESLISEAPMDGVAPGSMEGKKHLCATKVMHKEWKEGKTLFSQHAEPNEIGLIEWYDVMFDHGIEKKVPTRDLEVLVSESHMMHNTKKK
jgi:hypothetical protein